MKEMLNDSQREVIHPDDLKPGERKVVIYSNRNKTVVVPDKNWDGNGDLSRLPESFRNKISQSKKFGINRRWLIIGRNDNKDLGVPETTVIDDLDKKGYAELPRVEWGEEKIIRETEWINEN